ncbi:MAG: MutS-related protein [Thermoanaerobaculia bacterium]
MTEDYPAEAYRKRRERQARVLDALERRSRLLGRARLGAFLAAASCLVIAVVGTPIPRGGWLAAAFAGGAGFVVLVVLDARLGRRLSRVRALHGAYERALARRARDWRALDRLGVSVRAATGPGAGEAGGDGVEAASVPATGGIHRAAVARDLHLFGHASLERLLGTPGTPSGRATLAGWLLEPAGPEEVRLRQGAVRALAPELDWRIGLEARAWGPPPDEAPGGAGQGRPAPRRRGSGEGAVPPDATDPGLARFDEWLREDAWILRRPVLLWTARGLTLATPGTLLAWLAGGLTWPVWIPLAMAAYLLSARHAERMHRDFDRATAGGDALRGLGPVFRWLEGLPGAAPRLDELRGRLAAGGGGEGARSPARSARLSAARWMDRLERLTVLADARFGLVHFFVQVLLLWDVHLLARFELWRERAGPAARGWLDALGEVEALGALAALAHAQPDWAYPDVDPDADRYDARDLGHPLIPDERRVGNDVTAGPPGTFLLVTGSNMSGKTTLLRSLGTNAVLAQAGGPVCARELRMPPLALATSIGVEDSLEEGVSFFLAELLRLKEVVERAQVPPPERRVLYLLDEVLRGTNSAERRVAVQTVVGRLLALGALGAVTTHDLEILAEGELSDAARSIHFRETVHPRPGGGAEMSFDYRARPGLAPTTNALRLLEAVGLAPDVP